MESSCDEATEVFEASRAKLDWLTAADETMEACDESSMLFVLPPWPVMVLPMAESAELKMESLELFADFDSTL